MSLYSYKKYKISIDADSKKTEGFKIGDIVRRQYRDSMSVIYSLMVVLDKGIDYVVGADSITRPAPYFIGALLEGDAPTSGQLLNFFRVSNLFDEDRSGSLYLTSSDSGSPFMDIIDGLSKDKTLCYPYMSGGILDEADSTKYTLEGEEYASVTYTDSTTEASRILRITKNPADNINNDFIGLKQTISQPVANPQKVLVSLRIRASKELSGIPISFGYANGAQIDGSDTISVTTEWKYKLVAFIVDFPSNYSRSLRINLSSLLTFENDWCEISDLNMILLSDIANFSAASRARVGKLSGVIDPTLGQLDSYGGYFQSLYATKNVNIAGTLTAGDENGSASTFYVGKIHKNCLINSLYGNFQNTVLLAEDTPPTGIGSVFLLSTANIIAQTGEWVSRHNKHRYCFSFWAKGNSTGTITVNITGSITKSVNVTRSGEWNRYSVSFLIPSGSSNLNIQLTTNISVAYFCSAQLETGKRATIYQPTDAILEETNDYGAWLSKGGIGGTIQNPLLKLNQDGSISSSNGSFKIENSGNGFLANGAIRWEGSSVTFASSVTLDWSHISNVTGKITGTHIANNSITTDHFTANCVTADKIDVNSITALGTITAAEFNIGSGNFKVSKTGILEAIGANISGTITSTLGNIGGWAISSDSISASNIIISSTGTIKSVIGEVEKWSLNSNGKIYAKDIEISGGKISGWNIGADSIWIGEYNNTIGQLTGVDGSIVVGTNGLRSKRWRFDTNGNMFIGDRDRETYISFTDTDLLIGKAVKVTYTKFNPDTSENEDHTTDVGEIAGGLDEVYDEIDSINANLATKYARRDIAEIFLEPVTFNKGIVVKTGISSNQQVNAYAKTLVEPNRPSGVYSAAMVEDGIDSGSVFGGIIEKAEAAYLPSDLTIGSLINVADNADYADDGAMLIKRGTEYVSSMEVTEQLQKLMQESFPNYKEPIPSSPVYFGYSTSRPTIQSIPSLNLLTGDNYFEYNGPAEDGYITVALPSNLYLDVVKDNNGLNIAKCFELTHKPVFINGTIDIYNVYVSPRIFSDDSVRMWFSSKQGDPVLPILLGGEFIVNDVMPVLNSVSIEPRLEFNSVSFGSVERATLTSFAVSPVNRAILNSVSIKEDTDLVLEPVAIAAVTRSILNSVSIQPYQ